MASLVNYISISLFKISAAEYCSLLSFAALLLLLVFGVAFPAEVALVNLVLDFIKREDALGFHTLLGEFVRIRRGFALD